MLKPGVPRSIRLVNLLAALLFVAGAGVYAWAWIGLKRLHNYVRPPDAEDFAGMALFNHYWELSRIGFWLMVAALMVAVLATVAALVMRKRSRPPAP